MRYIKKFEMIDGKRDVPELGDYVICAGDYSLPGDFVEFLKNEIGKIKFIDQFYSYDIEYIWNGYVNHYSCNLRDILYCSKDKEELELILSTNKFNL